MAQWRARCEEEKSRNRIEPRVHGVAAGSPAEFFGALRAAMPRESCLVTDSGRHQELARRHFPVWCPRGLITPTNLQSMGFAVGAAIGAKIADPKRPVVALVGDGGIAMSGLELLTAVRERLDLTVIVFVDGAYAAIRDQQITSYGRASGTLLPHLDCAALAAAVGATHIRLDRDPENTLRDAVTRSGVTVVEVQLSDSLPMRWSQAKGLAKKILRRGK
jgi:acetolactate synthase-1/2/3 large subunit